MPPNHRAGRVHVNDHTGPHGTSAASTTIVDTMAVAGSRPCRSTSVPAGTTSHAAIIVTIAAAPSTAIRFARSSNRRRRSGAAITAAITRPTSNSPALVSVP